MNRFISCRMKSVAIFLFVICIIFIFLSNKVFAATYYVDGSVINDTGNGSILNPKKYISSGVGLLSGGDTLIIADGIYANSLDRIANIPSGSAGTYTTIRAETDFGVTLQGISPPDQWGAIIYMKNKEYIIIRGLKVYDTVPALANSPGSSFYAENSNHIKFIRCASDGTMATTAASGNVGMAFLTIRTPYLLMEECFAFGPGRYPFGVADGSTGATQGSNYSIFRRCVQRWDFSNNDEVKASFSAYSQQHVAFQNNIVVDGLDIKGPKNGVDDGIKAFFTPNGSEGDIHFDGNIVLNYEGAGFWIEDGPINTTYIDNSVVWDVKDDGSGEGYGAYLIACRYDDKGGSGPFNISRCTLGTSNFGKGIEFDLHGAPLTSASITNSIIMNIALSADVYAVAGGPTVYDYNYYYGNTGGRNKSGGVGANSVTNVNPLTNGLLYLTRIEAGSVLKTAGGGIQVGAEILYQIGRDADGDGVCGLVWGETGWDELQDGSGDSDIRPLWPFANEDVIRTDMKAFSKAANEMWAGSPAMSGDRGFCADGTTLTKYIWEYLGNPMPADIYSLNAPSGLNAVALSSTTILLDWIDNSNNENGFRIERKIGAGGIYNQIADIGANNVSYNNMGLNSGTTYFYRVLTYNISSGTSAFTNESSAVTYLYGIETPSTLNAVATSTGSVSLSWTDNSNNETGFKIERKTGVGGSYIQISLVVENGTTYNDLTLNSGTIYYYRVRATDGIIDSMYSNEKSVVTLGYSVNAPSNLNGVVISSTTVSLDWTDNSLDEQGFKIERKIGSGGSYSQIGTVGENVKVFDDTGLTTGTTYYYRIRSYNGSTNSDYLSEVSVVLVYAYTVSAPSQLYAVATSNNLITLSWADNSLDESGFKIERKIGSGGSYSQVGTVSVNVVSFSNSGLSAGSTYYYKVKAYNGSGDSGYSNEAYALIESDNGGIAGTGGGDAAKISIVSGEIKVVGSTQNRGTINPDEGDTAKIYFKGNEAGKFECRIFTLAGEIVWEDVKEGLSEGMFEWVPNNIASGGYVVHVKGPGVNVKGRIAIIR